MVNIRELLAPKSGVSSKRWIGIRSMQTLCVTSVLLTFAVLYQIYKHQAVDGQLALLCSANYASLASLAIGAFRKRDDDETVSTSKEDKQ